MSRMSLSRLDSMEILKLAWLHGTISRSQVAEISGASPFLVSKLCDQLLDAGFLTEAGQGDSTGGRRPTLLTLKSNLGRLMGVHLGTVNLRIALTDFKGNLIDYIREKSRAQEGPQVALNWLLETMDRMLRKAGLDYSEVDGLGVGVSGVLDQETGVTLFWPKLPSWVDVPIKNFLEERFSGVVKLDDTSRTQSLAEYRLGGAGSAKDFIYISLGVGVGAALFMNGQLYSGSEGFAGEFGHITVLEAGPVCSCGNRGCLETMVSASALIHRAQRGLATGLSNTLAQLVDGNSPSVSVEMLGRAAREGDRFSQRLLSETGYYLGRGIVGLINLLNPELIVIGGGVATAVGDLILPEIERVVRDRAMVQGTRNVQIRISGLAEKDWALGSTLLVAEQALTQSFQNYEKSKKLGKY